MVLLNWFRYALFLVIILTLFVVIDYGFMVFTTWGVQKIVNIFDWAWWKILLLGSLVLIMVRLLWRIMRVLVIFVFSISSYISPFVLANWYTITSIAILNFILLTYSIWTAEDSMWVLRIIFTYLSLQLTWAFYNRWKKVTF
jgi:hypothetical protein